MTIPYWTSNYTHNLRLLFRQLNRGMLYHVYHTILPQYVQHLLFNVKYAHLNFTNIKFIYHVYHVDSRRRTFICKKRNDQQVGQKRRGLKQVWKEGKRGRSSTATIDAIIDTLKAWDKGGLIGLGTSVAQKPPRGGMEFNPVPRAKNPDSFFSTFFLYDDGRKALLLGH